jgi:hypothetical protein
LLVNVIVKAKVVVWPRPTRDRSASRSNQLVGSTIRPRNILFLANNTMLDENDENGLDKEADNLSLEGTHLTKFGSNITPKRGALAINSSSSVISIIPQRAYNIHMHVLKRVR